MTDSTTQSVRLLAGRYEVGRLLGHGGMADVHLGHDTRLGRQVAIKLLKPALANDPAFRVRFRQEAQAAARMAHPTIVRVFDAGEETVLDGSGLEVQLPFIVMEHVEGRLLKDVLTDGPLEPSEAARIAAGVLTALEYSHRAGVVHRDIKPGNIMITASGQVKVMDFGIARAISESAATLAQTTAILGTAQYFSPEQARGESVDARADLYSTGVLLFELLTGRTPFRGDTPVAVAYQHLSEVPVAPSVLNPAVPPAFDAVVLRALAKDRFERFQDAAEFRAEVEAAASGRAATAAPLPGSSEPGFDTTVFGVEPTSAAVTEATVRQLTVDEDSRVARTQSRPPVAWIWAGISMMVAVVIAVVIWVTNLAPPEIANSASVQVPDIVGETWEAGEQTLLDAGLTARQFVEPSETVPEGTIIRTDPSGANEDRVEPGFTVQVWVSAGLPTVALPQIEGLSVTAAIERLQEAGLQVGQRISSNSPNVPKNQVMRAVPQDGVLDDRKVEQGATVDLIVSTGLVTVPDVRGLSSAEANSKLSALQLTVGVELDSTCSGGEVSYQSLAPGDRPQHSPITIHICTG